MEDVRAEHLATEQASKNDLGPILCGCQTVRIDAEAFRARSDLLTNDQAEERAVTDNLLQRTPRRFTEMDEEVSAREEALLKAVDEAGKQGIPPDCVRRLKRMVLFEFKGAFRRALMDIHRCKLRQW